MEVRATFHTIPPSQPTNMSGSGHQLENSGQQFLDPSDNLTQLVIAKFRSTLFLHTDPATIVLISLYLPIFLVAFLGNLLVLVVILPNRHMRSITNCFIVNLAIADLLVTVVCVPMAIGQSVYRPWIYGQFMCKITGYMQGVSVAASVFTIMMLSVDRYLAIRHPMTFRTYSNGRHALRLVVGVWLLSFAIMLPLIVVLRVDTIALPGADPLHFCKEAWRTPLSRQLYDSFLFIFMFIMPGCFVTISYSRLGCQLWSVSQQAQLYNRDTKVGKQQANHIMASRRQVARMLVFIAALFAICWMPYHILSLYLDFVELGPNTDLMAVKVLPFTIWLGHSNSALNPILYCFMNNSFRRYTTRMLHCHRRKRRKPPDSPVDLVVCYSKMNRSTRTSMRMTQRPLIRILSGSSTTASRSTSGSLRYSRSTNTSIKSSNASANMMNIRTPEQRRSPDMLLEKSVTPPSPCSVSLSLLNASSLSSPYSSDGDDVLLRYNFRSRREIFNYTLSIPTTINEESSRYSRTPSPHAERFTFRSLSEEFELPIPERSPLIAQASSCEWPNGNNSDAATDNEVRGRHNSEDSGHVTMTEDSAAAARADNYGSDVDVTDCPVETDKLLSDVPLLMSETQDGSCKLSQEMRIDDLEIHQLSESEEDVIEDGADTVPENLVRTDHILTKFGSAGRAEASA